MSRVVASIGPAHPRLGRFVERSFLKWSEPGYRRAGFHRSDSPHARERMTALHEKLDAGERVLLLGITPAGHNSGASLVEVSRADGIVLLSNNEEERFTGVKHCDAFPEHSLRAVREQLESRGQSAEDLHACLAGWDYPRYLANMVKMLAEHLPFSWRLMDPRSVGAFNPSHAIEVKQASKRLGEALGLGRPMPIIGMRHHDNHAALSWAISPFAHDDEPVMVTVLDGFGDDGAISLYRASDGGLECLRQNGSTVDSLGVLYSILSSTQGGWSPLSSEGRYMGAAAWGDGERLTNPYYKRLRQLVHFGPAGHVEINRCMWNVHLAGQLEPYNETLCELLGDPIALDDMWNPDAVLDPEDIRHAGVTRDRVDKAAATQLLFEDVVFHVVEHLIRTTGSHRLVMAGGTALNCLTSMRLVEHFDRAWFRRVLDRDARLELWIPPTPGDAGIPAGAAFSFALASGAKPGAPLRHAFLCGRAPSSEEIESALSTTEEIGFEHLADASTPEGRERIADLMATLVSADAVIGLYQGAAETGPRALGHRSILANPRNRDTLAILNERVKRRESVRPLAPMATLEAADRFFELSTGAATNDFCAYDFMVLTARARPEALERLPAVVHRDGTSRVQIVRSEVDPLTHAFLVALGRRNGAEVCVNTSLNVGAPIAQTPVQALETLRRARGMDGLFLIGADGRAFVAWHKLVGGAKDGGGRLLEIVRCWRGEAR